MFARCTHQGLRSDRCCTYLYVKLVSNLDLFAPLLPLPPPLLLLLLAEQKTVSVYCGTR